MTQTTLKRRGQGEGDIKEKVERKKEHMRHAQSGQKIQSKNDKDRHDKDLQKGKGEKTQWEENLWLDLLKIFLWPGF